MDKKTIRQMSNNDLAAEYLKKDKHGQLYPAGYRNQFKREIDRRAAKRQRRSS